jgi:threonine-phosphate decarboxylase
MTHSVESVFYEHGGNVYAASRRLGCSVGEILDFSANINPYGPPPGALCALAQARLGDYPCQMNFIETAAHKAGLPGSNVVVGNGTAGLIFAVVRAIRPKRALLIEPAFGEYRRALQLVGAEITNFPVSADNEFMPDFAHLNRTLVERRCDFLVLNTPHNPTGVAYPLNEISATLSTALQCGVFVFLDAAFAEYAPDGLNALSQFVVQPNVFVSRSLTKFYAMPGLRIGYGVSHPKIAARIAAQIEPWSVSTPALDAACAALDDADYERRTIAKNCAARERFQADLRRIGIDVFPSEANFLLIRLQRDNGAHLGAWLEERRILVRRCHNFIGLGDRFIRLAVRTPKENATLVNFLHDRVRLR